MSVRGTCDQKYSLLMDPVSNTNIPFRFCTYASSSSSCDCNEDKKMTCARCIFILVHVWYSSLGLGNICWVSPSSENILMFWVVKYLALLMLMNVQCHFCLPHDLYRRWIISVFFCSDGVLQYRSKKKPCTSSWLAIMLCHSLIQQPTTSSLILSVLDLR